MLLILVSAIVGIDLQLGQIRIQIACTRVWSARFRAAGREGEGGADLVDARHRRRGQRSPGGAARPIVWLGLFSSTLSAAS